MNKRKLVLQVIGTLLGLYLMVIYAINARAEATSAAVLGGNFRWLVPTLWLCVVLFGLETMLLWLTQRVSTTPMMVISVLTVIFALLAYFLGLSVWVPLMWTVVFSIILVTVSMQAE